MSRRVWFDRRFVPGVPSEALPDLVERLRGTPARLRERVAGLERATLVRHVGGRWSIQENAGHLLDLEPLWAGRLDDLRDGRETLREADLQNRRTHEAGHDDADLQAILAAFADLRARFVGRLEDLDGEGLRRSALHPRLRQPMTAADLAFFVAEHDDHHLAAITVLRRDRGDALS